MGIKNKKGSSSKGDQPNPDSRSYQRALLEKKPYLLPLQRVERQVLDAEVLVELRLACALVLKETGPSDEEYADILAQPDPLEIFQNEMRDIDRFRDKVNESKTSLGRKKKEKSSKTLKESSDAGNKRPKTGYSTTSKKPEHKPRSKSTDDARLPGTDRKSSAPAVDAAIARAKEENERKSSSASNGPPPAPPPKSGQPGLHSDVQRPVIPERKSSGRVYMQEAQRRLSSGSLSSLRSDRGPRHLRDSSSVTGTASRVYQAQELARHKSQESLSSVATRQTYQSDMGVPTLYPALKRPESRQSLQSAQSSRPMSRASSFVESIKDGIRGYVMPRPSIDFSHNMPSGRSSRNSRSASRSSSRPESRSSSIGARFRGATQGLRRKSSWSSVRSIKQEDEERRNNSDGGRVRSEPGVVDLNRSLPPLPGLDQYKEPKEPKTHIAHLLMGAQSPEANAANALNQGVLGGVGGVGAGFGPAISGDYYDNDGGAEVAPIGRVPMSERTKSLTRATANSSLHMNPSPLHHYSGDMRGPPMPIYPPPQHDPYMNGLSSVTTIATAYDPHTQQYYDTRRTMSLKDHHGLTWHHRKQPPAFVPTWGVGAVRPPSKQSHYRPAGATDSRATTRGESRTGSSLGVHLPRFRFGSSLGGERRGKTPVPDKAGPGHVGGLKPKRTFRNRLSRFLGGGHARAVEAN